VKKVLLLPFMSIQSGHHQVADAMKELIQRAEPDAVCEKVDLFSYSFGKLETFLSGCYIRWIHWLPGIYSWLYKKAAYSAAPAPSRYFAYEVLFLRFMHKLILEKKPDLIVCTHCLPSYMASRLKRLGLIRVPIVNVYTDFFVNQVWGRKGVDFHFVPDHGIREHLLAEGVSERQIYITGIPVHPHIARKENREKTEQSKIVALLTGGSLGAGTMKALIEKTNPHQRHIHYKVLCGKNIGLYNHLRRENFPHITPLPYIQSKEEMNDLYNEIDVILTKPGGVTISECLKIGVPILVYHSLPGQEEINFQYLLGLGLVSDWHDWDSVNLEEKIQDVVRAGQEKERLQRSLSEYGEGITDRDVIAPLGYILQQTSDYAFGSRYG
jgi:processive 1,2-diacylglycerol beta-glucosyltransferase